MTPDNASKPTIAVDMDDVLAALAESFVNFTNQKWGTNLSIDDYDEHWTKLWKVDDKEAYRRREEFFKLYPGFKAIPGALEVLKELSQRYELVIITSRRKKIDSDTQEWLKKNYEGIFSEIHYSGIWDDDSLHVSHKINLTKGEICRQIGADYLIDDQPKHCIAAAEAGVKAILFGDYGWNRDTKLIPNMVRAKTWNDVLTYFKKDE